MFKMIDTDNSGCITFKELKDGLKNFGADLDESGIRDLMQSVSPLYLNLYVNIYFIIETYVAFFVSGGY